MGHVLGRFTPEEKPVLEAVLNEVSDGIERIRRQGIERAGNRLNAFRAGPAGDG